MSEETALQEQQILGVQDGEVKKIESRLKKINSTVKKIVIICIPGLGVDASRKEKTGSIEKKHQREWLSRISTQVEGNRGTAIVRALEASICNKIMSNTKDRISPHFQTPRRELIILAAEYF